jgi:hypothetical protein
VCDEFSAARIPPNSTSEGPWSSWLEQFNAAQQIAAFQQQSTMTQ